MKKSQTRYFVFPKWIRGTHFFKVMRITVFLILIGMSNVFASSTYSQSTKFTFHLRNISLEQLFEEIQNQSEFNIFYKVSQVDENKEVNVTAEEASVEDILTQALDGTNLEFKIIEKQIVIFPSKILVNERTNGAEKEQSLQNIISGKVTDSSGAPLPGVTVVIKGTTKGTITNADGNYTLTQIPADATLIFSFVGMSTQEIEVAGKNTIDIVMEEESFGIEEVVAVGYGTQKKINLTGSVSQVKMDDVIGMSPAINTASALQGVIPGLQVTRSSTPGKNSNSLQIRGILSINGGSPLILIDGVPGEMGMLNPNDIETVSVLKDAASSAIYGAQAAGGVVLITTKHPASNATFKFDYSNSFGFETVTNTPKQASLETYLNAYIDADFNGGEFWAGTNTYMSTWLDYLAQYKKDPSSLDIVGDGIYRDEVGGTYYLNDKDVFKSMLNTGFFMDHNFSASGGTDKLRYRMSAGINSESGPLYTSKDRYVRKNIRGYISADVTDWMTVDLDLSYAQSDKRMPLIETGNIYSLARGGYYPEGMMPAELTISGEELPILTSRNLLLYSNDKKKINDNPRIFIRSKIKPVKNFDVVFEYSYNKQNEDYSHYSGQWEYTTIQLGTIESVASDYYEKEKYFTDENNINVYGTYSKQFGTHSLKIMGGFNQESSYYEYLYTIAYDQAVQSTPSYGGATGISTIKDKYSEYTSRSGFYRINYNYKDRYLLETNGRYDGSSKFPKNSRFGFFPSVSAGWRMGKEEFMRFASPYLSELKLRASYGSIGNQSIDPYEYTPSMSVSQKSTWLVDDDYVTVISSPGLVSGDFTWETITTLDFGADFSLLKNRLQGTFDWYQRDTKNMLTEGAVELPAVVGADAPLQNTASMRTRGWELSLNWNNKINEKLAYRVGLSLYDKKSWITKYYNNESGLISDYYAGKEINSIWGYIADGYYSVDDFEDTDSWELKDGVPSIEGYIVKPGDMKFKNLNDDDGSINQIDSGTSTVDDPGDRKIIGNTTPRYLFAVNLGVSYGGFDLNAVLQGVGKRDYWVDGDIMFPFGGESQADALSSYIYYNQTDYWKPISTDPTSENYMVAENPDAKYYRIYDQCENIASNTRNSDKYLQNAAYMRVKNVSLTYTFPKKWIERYQISKLKVFTNVENLATFTSLPKGIDPELMDWGYPFYRTVTVGLNVTF